MAAAPPAFKWAIGLGLKEAVYGVTEAIASLTDWFKVKEADLTERTTSWETDEDEITGFLGATEHNVFEVKGAVSRKCKLTLELLTWALEMMLGTHVDAGTTPDYTSTIKWRDKCTINPPSFSYLEALDCPGSTATWFSYKGAVVESITVAFNGKGPGELTLAFKNDGSEVAQPSVTLPVSAYAATKLFGYMLSVKLGPLGTEDISALIRSWKMTITMGSVEPPSISGGVYVSEVQYGLKNPKIDIEIVAKADKSSVLYGYADADTPTTVKLVSAIVVSAARQIVLTNTQGKVTGSVKPSGNEFQITLKFMEEHTTTDSGPGVFVAKTGVAAWLAASP